MYSRKQEESLEELEELVVLYDEFVENYPNIKSVDANKSREEVLHQICKQFKLTYAQ